jgi:hypothetical protein
MIWFQFGWTRNSSLATALMGLGAAPGFWKTRPQGETTANRHSLIDAIQSDSKRLNPPLFFCMALQGMVGHLILAESAAREHRPPLFGMSRVIASARQSPNSSRS